MITLNFGSLFGIGYLITRKTNIDSIEKIYSNNHVLYRITLQDRKVETNYVNLDSHAEIVSSIDKQIRDIFTNEE